MDLASLIPTSNTLNMAFARSANGGSQGELAKLAYSTGFVGAFTSKTEDDSPTWAVRVANYTRDEFFSDTPGSKHLFSEVAGGLPAGDGARAVPFRHAIDFWRANGGIEPYGIFQEYGDCVDVSLVEMITGFLAWRAAQGMFGEIYKMPVASYWYANRGYCSDGWSGSGIATVARRVGVAFRQRYDLVGGDIDFTDADYNERVTARTWCRSGIPDWLSRHTQANHPFEDGAITAFDGGLDAFKSLLAAMGGGHCGGVRTSGGPRPFSPGRTGPHMQSAVGYDDSEEYRKWLLDNHQIRLPESDFAVIMHQTWGRWSGQTGSAYWPSHLWGEQPEGAWVCKASYILPDVEYAYLPNVKGFPGVAPQPPMPDLSAKLHTDDGSPIRGEIRQGDHVWIVAKAPDGSYGVIPKPQV